jgi:hypothetical protein
MKVTRYELKDLGTGEKKEGKKAKKGSALLTKNSLKVGPFNWNTPLLG